MGKFPIGYIFATAEVKRITVNEEPELEFRLGRKSYVLILLQKYIPEQLEINKCKDLKNLVLIGYTREGRFIVAIEGYWPALRREYSYSKSTLWKWNKWYKRWEKECGKGFKNNFEIQKVDFPIIEPVRSLYALNGTDYILPVLGCKNLEHLNGSPLFYPHVVSKNCIYKTDANGPSDFPKYYKTKINVDDRRDGQIVHIYFHGFCFPAKWHHCIWKHVFALTRETKKGEKALWEKYCNIEAQPGTIFDKCKENYKGFSCNTEHCVSKKLFRGVHADIKEECEMLLKNFVTSFESDTTKFITVRNGEYDAQYKEITVLFRNKIKTIEEQNSALFGSIITTAKKQEAYQYAKLTGTCYNWRHKIPVLHISPQTMYLDVVRQGQWWLDKEVKKSKGNIIFTGKFSEAKLKENERTK